MASLCEAVERFAGPRFTAAGVIFPLLKNANADQLDTRHFPCFRQPDGWTKKLAHGDDGGRKKNSLTFSTALSILPVTGPDRHVSSQVTVTSRATEPDSNRHGAGLLRHAFFLCRERPSSGAAHGGKKRLAVSQSRRRLCANWRFVTSGSMHSNGVVVQRPWRNA